MKSGNGSWSTNRTRKGSTTTTSRTRSFRIFAPFVRWKLNFTSSAVNGSPLWKRSPSRSLNSYARWSALIVHDSARLGAIRFPGIGFTSASWIAYITQNGVICPIVSAGSNHIGASVT